MCRIRFTIFVILLGFASAADRADAGEAEAWAALRAGRHVALMRHADAPGGVGDPAGFRIDDCATQRNLSAKGREDAAKIGKRLKSEGIALEKIISSPWCRCMETATLLQLGPVAGRGDIRQCGRAERSATIPYRRRPRRHRPMDRKRDPSCRHARCKHRGAHRHLAGERRNRRGPDAEAAAAKASGACCSTEAERII